MAQWNSPVLSTHKGDFAKIWQNALDEFCKKTKTMPSAVWLAQLRSVSIEGLLEYIATHNQTHKGFIDRKAAIFKSLNTFLIPVQAMSNVARAAAQIAFPPAQAVFAAIAFAIDSAKGAGDVYNAIAELLSRMRFSGIRLEIYFEHELSQQLAEIATNTLVLYLKILALSINMIKSGHWGRTLLFAKKTFLGTDGSIRDTLNELRDLEQQEINYISALTYGTLLHVAERMGDEHFKQRLQKPSLTVQEYEFGKRNIKAFHEIRGEWLMTEPAFARWCRCDFPILWLCGLEGTGKSFLLYHIVHRLRERNVVQRRHRGIAVTYFFCGYERSTDTDESLLLLATIMGQLAAEDSSYRDYLYGLPYHQPYTDPSRLFKHYLLDFLNADASRSVIVVLHGVEKMNRPSLECFFDMLTLLDSSNGDCSRNLSVLLLSTYEIGELIHSKIEVTHERIEITAQKIEQDLDNYIATKVSELSELHQDPNRAKNVFDYLRANARGSFSLVNSMLHEFPQDEVWRLEEWKQDCQKQFIDVQAFRLSLTALEAKLKPYQVNTLNHILLWICSSTRSLSVRALDQALYIRTAQGAPVSQLAEMLYYKYGSIFDLRTESGNLHSVKHPLLASQELKNRTVAARDLAFRLRDGNVGESESDAQDEAVSEIGKPEDAYLFVSVKTPAVRDYLLSGHGQVGGGTIRAVKSRVTILSACLRIFCSEDLYGRCTHGLAVVAASFAFFLVTINPHEVELQDRLSIGRLLIQVLQNGPALQRWVSAGSHALTTDFYVLPEAAGSIQAWICDLEVFPRIPREWCSSVERTPFQILFKDAAVECARRWTSNDAIHADTEVVFLANYKMMAGSRPTIYLTSLMQLDPQHINVLWLWAVRMMEGGEYDRNILHHRLPKTLLRAGYIHEAIRHGRRGLNRIRLEDEKGYFYALLARAYARAGDLEQACFCLRQSQSELPPDDVNTRRSNAMYLYRLGAQDLPSKVKKPTKRDTNGRMEFAARDLDDFIRHGDFEEATQLLERLVGDDISIQPTEDWNRFFQQWSKHIPHHHRMLIYALEAPQGVELIERLYSHGVEILARYRMFTELQVLTYFYARFRSRMGADSAEVTQRLESTIAGFDGLETCEWTSKISYIAEVELQNMRLREALKSNRPGYIKTLEGQLAQSKAPHNRILALMAATWYRQKKQSWDGRKLLKPFVEPLINTIYANLESLAALSSTELWTPWYHLADVLVAAEKPIHAIAALSYIKQSRVRCDQICFRPSYLSETYCGSAVSRPTITWTPSSSDSRDTEPKHTEPKDVNLVSPEDEIFEAIKEIYPEIMTYTQGQYSGFTCDACGRAITCCETSYRCTICTHVDLCFHCRERLQAGKLHINVCGSSHSWLCLPPEHFAFSAGKIRVGYRVPDTETIDIIDWAESTKNCEVDVKEWLNSMWEGWEVIPSGGHSSSH